MTFIYESKEQAINSLKERLENNKDVLINNLLNNISTDYYSNSDVEFILEAFDGNTNHVIKNGTT